MQTLSQTQKSILNGLMLGDGCLLIGKSNLNAKLSIARSEKDIEYLRYHHGIFKDFCSGEGIIRDDKMDKARNKKYIGYKFRTRALPIFTDWYNRWYPNGHKFVPKDFVLDPTVMATWICDDGSIAKKKDRNKIYSSALRLKISTNGFQKEDVEFLANLLHQRYKEKFSLYHDSLSWYKKKNPFYVEDTNINWFIRTYTKGTEKIFEDIENAFPIGMERKLIVWKEHSHF